MGYILREFIALNLIDLFVLIVFLYAESALNTQLSSFPIFRGK